MGRAEHNAVAPDFIVCAVTSRITSAANSVLVDRGDLVLGHLPATSRVKVARVASLAQSLVVKRIGRLNEETLDRVYRELRALFP